MFPQTNPTIATKTKKEPIFDLEMFVHGANYVKLQSDAFHIAQFS